MKNAPSRSVVHSTFVIERTFDAFPARVFAAFAKKEAKAKWFTGPEGWVVSKWDLDFRVGGREINVGGAKDGRSPQMSFEAIYLDIVDDERIVYAYTMFMDDKKLSASLASIELSAVGERTRLVLTEQGAFLDGHDLPKNREEGTRALLEAVAASL